LKYLLFIILGSGLWSDTFNLSKKNQQIIDAQISFAQKDFKKCQYLLDEILKKDPKYESALLNKLAINVLLNDSSKTQSQLQLLDFTNNSQLEVQKYNLLALNALKYKRYLKAKEYYKMVVDIDFRNNQARNNYELLNKLFPENPKQQDSKTKEQQNNTANNTIDPKETKMGQLNRFEGTQPTDEQAKKIFNALNNKPNKYLFQEGNKSDKDLSQFSNW
jgi:tetratricopeptide (TPR) repeat protein